MITNERPKHPTTILKKANELYLKGLFLDSLDLLSRKIESGNVFVKPLEVVDALQTRGWVYRQIGEFESAKVDLSKGYIAALQTNEFIKAAKSLILLGDIYSFLIDRTNALDSCNAALYLLENNHANTFALEFSMLYSTLGEIYRRFDQFNDAVEQYNQALELLNINPNQEWISISKCGRGTVLYKIRETEAAIEDLTWVLDNGVKYLMPRAMHYQAKILWVRGRLQEALEMFQKSRMQNQDIFYSYRSFSDMLDLYWEVGEYPKWENLHNILLNDYSKRTDIDSLRLFGSCLRKLGDLAICAGSYEPALGFYRKGFPIISTYEVHNSLTVWEQLLKTELRIKKVLPRQVLEDLGNDLLNFWISDKKLSEKSPAVLSLFYLWINRTPSQTQ